MPALSLIDASLFERSNPHVYRPFQFDGAQFTSARGSIVTDVGGREYIDFMAGRISLNYGHNDPDMKAALIDHIASDGLAYGLDFHTAARVAFLDAFETHILRPRGMDHRAIFTGPTGADAVEAAAMIARKATGRWNVVAFTNACHIAPLGDMPAVTGAGYQRGQAGTTTSNGMTVMPYDRYMGEHCNTVEFLEAMLDDRSGGADAPAAIILETVQGRGGLNAASDEWVRRVARIARKNGVLLIVDDIQAGCGRCGSFFSYEDTGITPDIVILGKSVSGFGFPMGLLLVRPEYDAVGPAEHSGTLNSNTHALVTARVAIKKFWSDAAFRRSLTPKARALSSTLADLKNLIPGAKLKGRGLMLGVDVGSGDVARKICLHAFRKGLMIETSCSGGQVVEVLAPLTTPDAIFQKGLAILLDAFQEATTTA